MYEIANRAHSDQEPFRFALIDENGSIIATVRVIEDAEAITTALELYEMLESQFPGLFDGETDVNGADLVDAITTVCFWKE